MVDIIRRISEHRSVFGLDADVVVVVVVAAFRQRVDSRGRARSRYKWMGRNLCRIIFTMVVYRCLSVNFLGYWKH